jgi:hypothetical protein
VPVDADLRLVVDAWLVLPEPIQAGIVAMVKAATLDTRGGVKRARETGQAE